MDFFNYTDGHLMAEENDVAKLANRYGTPLYIYSRATFERHWHAFDSALGAQDHLICYAVKANSNLGVLNLLTRLGSGFDIVSIGELERVLASGGSPDKIVFSGVGKRYDEIKRALEVGIYCFNLESEAEIERVNDVASEMGVVAPVSIRVNPDVDANTHPYISTGLKSNKFGIPIENARTAYQRINQLSHLKIMGVDCHIGSQLLEIAPFIDALKRVLILVDDLRKDGIKLHHLDLGGGLGIPYRDETPPTPSEYAAAIKKVMAGRLLKIILEPGRAIAGNAGILVTRVEFLKHTDAEDGKNFAIVDVAMNDLMRPALYQAWQAVLPVVEESENSGTPAKIYDLVGPICETGDFLAKDRSLAIKANDLLVIRSAGAYGFSMSSNYNSRPRAAEVMVDGEQHYLVRERESLSSLFQGESVLP
ncbi:MAG: diaminopimelate decarboxylase [gamma proteobacterium symbiont of Lucinoma myriamae]|nr:diaminopimelate decarboxylase [gamma proteobacterium symbiont of Lucinoma myriamae]MCU7819885.1 diaminopimelate decarboxylase [gamma proteobacterium symbiont of Lucinoma myriamae]MCU7833466.1 diaminopimelate decarboxylase [gamma proteobacterium symbiont of Lucinoma myriamae]